MVYLSKVAPECLIYRTTPGPRPTATRARTALFPDGVSQNMRQRSVPKVSPTAGSRAQNDGIRQAPRSAESAGRPALWNSNRAA
jgi:hypothetical protein